MYDRILQPLEAKKRKIKIKIAATMGLNQTVMFCVMAGLFWAGAEIIIQFDG
jgi:hypothetical protein